MKKVWHDGSHFLNGEINILTGIRVHDQFSWLRLCTIPGGVFRLQEIRLDRGFFAPGFVSTVNRARSFRVGLSDFVVDFRRRRRKVEFHSLLLSAAPLSKRQD
jgi:hypothetical protein